MAATAETRWKMEVVEKRIQLQVGQTPGFCYFPLEHLEYNRPVRGAGIGYLQLGLVAKEKLVQL